MNAIAEDKRQKAEHKKEARQRKKEMQSMQKNNPYYSKKIFNIILIVSIILGIGTSISLLVINPLLIAVGIMAVGLISWTAFFARKYCKENHENWSIGKKIVILCLGLLAIPLMPIIVIVLSSMDLSGNSIYIDNRIMDTYDNVDFSNGAHHINDLNDNVIYRNCTGNFAFNLPSGESKDNLQQSIEKFRNANPDAELSVFEIDGHDKVQQTLYHPLNKGGKVETLQTSLSSVCPSLRLYNSIPISSMSGYIMECQF